MKKQIPFIAVMVAIGVAAIYLAARLTADCEEKGGVLLKTAVGYQCVRTVERVK